MASDYWFKGWEVGFEDRILKFKIKTGVFEYAFVCEYDALELDQWYHIGVEYNVDTMAIYIGG